MSIRKFLYGREKPKKRHASGGFNLIASFRQKKGLIPKVKYAYSKGKSALEQAHNEYDNAKREYQKTAREIKEISFREAFETPKEKAATRRKLKKVL